MKSLKIVFMGTAAFAVATLGSLLMNGYDVLAAAMHQINDQAEEEK